MEINDSSRTKKSHHDHVVWSSSEYHDPLSQSSGNFKSYTCSFCKKGFSNAQALGGHMNIHRKDRARLRQAFADEVLLSLDTTSSASDSIERDHHHGSQDSDDKSILIAEPNDDHRRNEDDAFHPNRCSKKMQKQPVFVETNSESSEPGGDEKIQSGIHDLPQVETLELELRLGPEAHDTTVRSRRELTE